MKRFSMLVLTLAASIGFTACGGSADEAAATSAAAANPFRGLTTTAAGLSTWDSDLIDVERVPQTGAGVYVAVLDTGLAPNWRDYFPEARVATALGTGFDQPVAFTVRGDDPCKLGFEVGQLRQTTWVGSTTSTHGTHVTSTILGYAYRSNADAAQGEPLPPVVVRGIAPGVTVVPVKVLADYQLPARPQCTDPGPLPAEAVNFGTDAMVAAGIRYATDLANRGFRPMVINMSLGGDVLDPVEQAAIDDAIAAGVVVVAAAGNEGAAGMSFPGAYAPVISAGAAGWRHEFRTPANIAARPAPVVGDVEPRFRLWWLQSSFYPFQDVTEPAAASDVYVADFSSRELAGQDLDVLAPGSWVRGPFAGTPGFNHLPWWSSGIADLRGRNTGNFFYVGGTSMATPHVASLAAMMLQKNPSLTQAQVESILETTALPILAGSMVIHDIGTGFELVSWGADAVGSGLVQAGAALAATPAP